MSVNISQIISPILCFSRSASDRMVSSCSMAFDSKAASLYKFLFRAICNCLGVMDFVDLSFNQLTTVDEQLARYKDLACVYLHGNKIAKLKDLKFLKALPNLRKLTLHGNLAEVCVTVTCLLCPTPIPCPETVTVHLLTVMVPLGTCDILPKSKSMLLLPHASGFPQTSLQLFS